FKISNSPWANFFPTEIVDSVNIEFIVKKPKDPKVKIIAWDDKSKRYELPYVDALATCYLALFTRPLI
ncbi:hypothetical protein, partial [Spiroplasma endosymbiont of Danaus chrysippus]|uniref:hypothetical protein n=1 Tax=Spiroplasma endosymbiont of Danaus chrysippus TaxID=2691041 RepID=UPI001E323D95